MNVYGADGESTDLPVVAPLISKVAKMSADESKVQIAVKLRGSPVSKAGLATCEEKIATG